MRVVIAHSRYRQPGGEERHVDLLARGLREAGADVAVYAPGPAGDGLGERLRLAAGLAYRPAAGRALARELARRPADVVHFHNLMPLLTPAALRAAKRAGAAVILTVHNYRFACPAGTLLRAGRVHEDCVEGSSLLCGLRNARGSLVESLAYGVALEVQRRLRLLERWVDAFVAPSAFVARMLARAGFPGDRVHVVAHGIPPGEAPREPREYALFAGRLSPEKGVETLLAAAGRTRGVRLLIAGRGLLEEAVRRAVNGTVAYAGALDDAALARVRSRAAFAVVPSTAYETFPLAALEALAAGVPVVASRIGGLPEIVEHGVSGLLVPPGDPVALAAAMQELWDDPARAAAMGSAGRRIAAERFSLEGQTRALLALYASLRERA